MRLLGMRLGGRGVSLRGLGVVSVCIVHREGFDWKDVERDEDMKEK